MDQLGFNSGNSGILESTWEYLGITWGSYGNDLGMTQEYLGDSGRVWDMTGTQCPRDSMAAVQGFYHQTLEHSEFLTRASEKD